MAVSAWSAPRKGTRPAAKPAAPETVFVQVTPAVRTVPAAPAQESRRSEAAFSSSDRTRNYGQAYGLNVGMYTAEVLGNNPYAELFWNMYPSGQPYFFEFGAGVGTVQSSFSEKVVGGAIFENSFMITGEALGGFALSGSKSGNGRGAGLFPYILGGVTTFYQGGVPNVGGVVGFGNRMGMPGAYKWSKWALNYGLRDYVYSQKLRGEPSLTQNIVLLVGVQMYK